MRTKATSQRLSASGQKFANFDRNKRRKKMNTLNTNLLALSQGPMKKPFRRSAALALLLALCLLCSTIVPAQSEFTAELSAAAAEQSFFVPTTWARELTAQQGWGPQYPRLLADVNNDKRQDVVGFGIDGVWFATSTGFGFAPAFVLADFGYQSGWRVEKHVRTTADINGDKLEDIVGFGETGVYRALQTSAGFGPTVRVVANFGYEQGWRVDKHVRLLADVNGDGRKDIVAFGDHGVWLSLATAGGFFTAPAFVVAEFGYNQGWRLTQHPRTTADLNGDGRQDIVGFADDGVWVAYSTGNGFGPAHRALDGFGPLAGGWRVDRHPRFFADINGDRKQDIVGFGDDGVWVAHSTGSGFAAAQYVLAEFGYNQGWRVGRHPRFVADLNGDGYQDIVGFGEDLIYRSLGSPTGFTPMRGVLRDLIAGIGFPWNSTPQVLDTTYPRLVGDVTGDGRQDLIAFDKDEITVARSSNLPPPPPPNAPSNARITHATENTLYLAWNDNSNDERHFLVNFGKAGGSTQTVSLNANVTARAFSGLDPDTRYCFRVQAENIWGFSAESAPASGRTQPQSQTTNKGPFDTSIFMSRQPIVQGFVPYAGSFGPIFEGALISKINFPTQYPAVLLVKPGHSTNECGNPSAVVRVHGDMTAEQKTAIWGSATPRITGQQRLNFVGCTTSSQLPNLHPVNLTWSRP
jgi:hypothetical protein